MNNKERVTINDTISILFSKLSKNNININSKVGKEEGSKPKKTDKRKPTFNKKTLLYLKTALGICLAFPILTIFGFYFKILTIEGITRIVKSMTTVNITYVLLLLLLISATFLLAVFVNNFRSKFLIATSLLSALIISLAMINGTLYLLKLSDTMNDIVDENITRLGVATIDRDFDDLASLNSKYIGIISNEILPHDNSKTKEEFAANNVDSIFIEFNDYIEMIHSLNNGELSAIIVPSEFYELFSPDESVKEIVEEMYSIHEFEFKVAIEGNDTQEYDLTTKPISILLVGVDSGEEGFSSRSNSDVLIFTTFNPNTMKVTMTSIPRDSYVEIACRNNVKDKITHVNGYGSQCLLDTVEQLFDTEIDFYVKVNFNAVVDVVDALGGIYLNSPAEITAQNSDDQRGTFNIYIPFGDFQATGEQALAFARERKRFPNGDIGRGLRQQQVIMAIADKASKTLELNVIDELLQAAGENLNTNFTTGQITALAGHVFEKINKLNYKNPIDMFDIVQYNIAGYDNKHYDYFMERILYYYIPFQGNIADLRAIVKEQLEIEMIPRDDSSMYYSIHQIYYPFVLADKDYNEKRVSFKLPDIVPAFVSSGYTYNDIKTWAAERSLKVNVNEIREGNPDYNPDLPHNTVLDQSPRAQKLVEKLDSVTIDLIKHNLDCKVSENRVYDECDSIILDFYQYKVEDIKEWKKAYDLTIIFEYEPFNPEIHDTKNVGLIISQSVKAWSTFAENVDEITFKILEGPRVIIPDFTGYIYDKSSDDELDLDKWISDNGLNRVTFNYEINDSIPDRTFVNSNFNIGDQILISEEFVFTISKGPSRISLVQAVITINKDQGELYSIDPVNVITRNADGSSIVPSSDDMARIFGDDEAPGTYTVVYSIVDSYGESYDITQEVLITVTKPTLVISGGNSVSITTDQLPYNLPVATASHGANSLTYKTLYNDAEITFLDGLAAGEYIIKYESVADANGNIAEQTLTVTITEPVVVEGEEEE